MLLLKVKMWLLAEDLKLFKLEISDFLIRNFKMRNTYVYTSHTVNSPNAHSTRRMRNRPWYGHTVECTTQH